MKKVYHFPSSIHWVYIFVHAGSLTKDPAKEVDRMKEDPPTTEDLAIAIYWFCLSYWAFPLYLINKPHRNPYLSTYRIV